MRRMVVRSDSRNRILAVLRAKPGLTVGALSARLGWDYKTVQYHVGILAKAKLVLGVRSGNRTLFVAAGSPAARRSRIDILVARASPRVRKLLTVVLAQPGILQASAARKTRSTVSTTHFHVERLVRWGVIRASKRVGRRGKRLSVHPKAKAAVRRALRAPSSR